MVIMRTLCGVCKGATAILELIAENVFVCVLLGGKDLIDESSQAVSGVRQHYFPVDLAFDSDSEGISFTWEWVILITCWSKEQQINDLQSSEIFKEDDGPEIIIDILSNEREDMKVLDGCFSVVAAAATSNEVLKESFMDLKIDELIF
ncbi:hypothetical protein ACS0TY_013769 [Phlomoides rotata]